jgi:hypothetical protein
MNIAKSMIKQLLKLIPDKHYLKLLFRLRMKEKLNLDNPKTFNEKLQWLKLFDRKEIYTSMVDKYEAKQYVSSIIGDEYIVPTLGVWNTFDEINFDELPRQFVLKCTHDSGGVVIVKDKEQIDLKKVRKIINESIKNNYYYYSREWPYKNIKPRIIAEEYLKDADGLGIKDYKFFTFNEKPKILRILTNGESYGDKKYSDHFDMEANWLPFKSVHDNAEVTPSIPKQFDKMRNIAEKLAQGTIHLRVDLYEVNDKIYFGEMTFYHWSGCVPFEPKEWDYYLGSLLQLKK